MTWFQKCRERKCNAEFEDIKEQVRINKNLGAIQVYMPINSHIIDLVKGWCASEGYKIEVDHMTDDTLYYKIYGWD